MRRFLPIAVAITATLLATSCGSSSSDSGGYGGSGQSSGGGYGSANKPAESGSAKSKAASIGVRKGTPGTYLVDGQGRSLYLFEADKGRTSTCTGACAQAWPPVTSTSKPKATQGVRASLLGTSRRGDGTSQVTYAGHPLYRYAGDQAAGDTAGQGLDQFGAGWYLLKSDGTEIDED